MPDGSLFCMYCGTQLVKPRQKKEEIKVPAPVQLPSGSWRIRLRNGGQLVSVTEATADKCVTKAKAIKSGMLKKQKALPRITLGKAMEKYISDRTEVLSASTIRGYNAIKNTRFLKYTDSDISTVNWQKAVNEEAKLCSPKTLKNAWGFVKAALANCGTSVDATLPKVPKADRPWLTPEQIGRFLEAIKDTPGELVALLALHSLRRSEIFALQWENINLDEDTITIRGAAVQNTDGKVIIQETNKTEGSARSVHIIIPRLKELLMAAEPKEGAVVDGWINSAYYQINKVCARAQLPAVGVHGLRHTFASLCFSQNVPELTVMKLGGWSDYQTVHRIYTHLAETKIAAGEDSLKAFFEDTKTDTKTGLR